jgi:hypothetical protein
VYNAVDPHSWNLIETEADERTRKEIDGDSCETGKREKKRKNHTFLRPTMVVVVVVVVVHGEWMYDFTTTVAIVITHS